MQDALKSRVPSSVIQLQKRLVDIISQPGGGAKALFEDGTSAYADLMIGADGIRSVSGFVLSFTAFTDILRWQGCAKSRFSCS